MAYYEKARNETKKQIQNAFWHYYQKYNYQNSISIKELTSYAGINRSTFYFYYHNTAEVLEDLISWLKSEIVDIYASQTRYEGDFNSFYKEMYAHFRKRKEYLIPLVCESRHPEFALWYRNNQRERFKEDVGLHHYRTDPLKNRIIDISLSGIIEEQIQTFAYGILTVDESFYLEYGMLQKGLIKTLADQFAITCHSELLMNDSAL